MLRTANALAITGTGFLAGGLTGAVFLITDVLFELHWAALTAALAALALGWLWYGLALARRATDEREEPSENGT